jgi:hypothetical protein
MLPSKEKCPLEPLLSVTNQNASSGKQKLHEQCVEQGLPNNEKPTNAFERNKQ